MDIQTEYCGTIWSTESFEWAMWLIGKTNSIGFKTEKNYFNAMKRYIKYMEYGEIFAVLVNMFTKKQDKLNIIPMFLLKVK